MITSFLRTYFDPYSYVISPHVLNTPNQHTSPPTFCLALPSIQLLIKVKQVHPKFTC